jgi:hypothetical protein
VGKGERLRAERAAELAAGGGAGDAVVAVAVVAREPPELVAVKLPRLAVVGRELLLACAAGGAVTA